MESKNNWKAWLYLAPVLILLAVFTFYPIINTIYVSFLKDYSYTRGTHAGFTFENYAAVLTPYSGQGGAMFDRVMKTALPNTLLITIITVPLSIIISMLIALGLNHSHPLCGGVSRRVHSTLCCVQHWQNGAAPQ